MQIAYFTLAATAPLALLSVAVWRNARRTSGVLERLLRLEAQVFAPVREDDVKTEAEAQTQTPAEAEAQETPAQPEGDVTVEELQPTQLFFRTADGKVALGVKKLDGQKLANLSKAAVAVPQARLGALGAVLQTVPGVLTHARIEGGQPMEVLVNGALAASRGAEELTAVLRGAGGKVVEQARLRDMPALEPLPAATLAATALALAGEDRVEDLDGSLNELVRELAWAREAPGNACKAALAKAVACLRGEALPAVQRGEMPPALGVKLETLARGLAGVQAQLLQQHSQLNRQTGLIMCPDGFDAEVLFKLLCQHVRKIDATRKQYVLAVAARLLCWRFLAMFPRDVQPLQALLDSVAEAAVAPEMACDYEPLYQAVLDQLDALDNALAEDNTLAHRLAGMKVYTRKVFDNTCEALTELKQGLDKVAAPAAARLRSLRLAVRVQEGKLEAFELKDVAAPADPAAAAAAPEEAAVAA